MLVGIIISCRKETFSNEFWNDTFFWMLRCILTGWFTSNCKHPSQESRNQVIAFNLLCTNIRNEWMKEYKIMLIML